MSKASGCDGIPVDLPQILKDNAVKVLHSKSANLKNSAVAAELEKFSFQSQRKAMPKMFQTTTQLHSSHMLVK